MVDDGVPRPAPEPARDLDEALRVARRCCETAGQQHLLAFADELAPAELAGLLAQIESLDFERVARLLASVSTPATTGTARLQPCELLEAGSGAEQLARDAAAREVGAAALAAGRVAAFLVAGGQGSRLGFDGPKGRFPVGPRTQRSLFAYHAQRVLATSRRHGAALPLYVMTSAINDADTRAAFAEAEHFGLDPADVRFLQQGLLPALTPQGKLLLESRSRIFMSPDGHGGALRALQHSGALADMRARGIEQIFYFQVDNPLARVLDPVFIGHHLLAGADMSNKVVAKTEPSEKVGVVARVDGRVSVVEYSDLPSELAAERDEQGRLRFRAGSIAIHVMALDFVERLLASGAELPVHRADKAVPHLGPDGRLVRPERPNAIKLEQFVFDALGAARCVVNQEVLREDEFAPVKNAKGIDSPESARAALSAQGKRWMAAAGLAVPPGPVEVGPLFALDCEEFLATLTRNDFGPVFDRC